MYGIQGQYSISPSPQTVSPYWALVLANVFYILSATIAAVLYGNIGLKGKPLPHKTLQLHHANPPPQSSTITSVSKSSTCPVSPPRKAKSFGSS